MKNAIALALVVLLLVAAKPEAQNPPATVLTPPQEVKTNFLRMLERPRAMVDIRNHEAKPPYRNLITERFDFASQIRADGMKERVPVLMVRPEGVSGRLPVVIVLHGTGGKKEGMWNWLEQLAHRGFLAVAIDGRYHGERVCDQTDLADYNNAIYAAYRSGAIEPQEHPFFYDTCWDVMRTIDYLVTRADVDAGRIGLMGTSKGGIETYLTAAVDDRVKVIIPAIAMQSFRWGLDHNRWQARANTVKQAHERVAADLGLATVTREVCQVLWAKIIPGIRDEFDGPSMVRLLAGRPTLILNGEVDANCPIEGAELAFEAARAAFHDVDADDKLKIMVAKETGHTITNEQHQAALDWMVTWLKPTVPPSTARYLFRKAHPTIARPVAPRLAGTPKAGRPQHPRPSRRPFGPKNPASAAPAIESAATSAILAPVTDFKVDLVR